MDAGTTIPPRDRGRRPFDDLARLALVVIDPQRLFCDPDSPAFVPGWAAVAPPIQDLVGAFLAAERPVFATRHVHPEGDDGGLIARLFGRLQRADDPLSRFVGGPLGAALLVPGVVHLDKARFSAFSNDSLAPALAGCDGVVFVGVQTHLCVLASALDTPRHGFVPVVVADATAARRDDEHRAALAVLSAGHAHVATVAEVRALLAAHTKTFPVAPLSPSPVESGAGWDILVVGAGPAGLSCGLQAARDGLRVLVIGDESPGGLVRAAWRIENYPGIPKGQSGARFADLLVAQCEAFGMTTAALPPSPGASPFALLCGRVSALQPHQGGFAATLENGACVRARAVVLATGTRPNPLSLAGFETVRGAGRGHRDVRTLPGRLAAPESARVLVLGGGEGAVDAALAARERGGRVTLALRGTTLKGSERLLRALLASDITVRPQSVAQSVALSERCDTTCVRFEGGAERSFDHVIVSIGRRPDHSLLAGVGGAAPSGVVTACAGLFAAGDMLRPTGGRYLASACGDGQHAATLCHLQRFGLGFASEKDAVSFRGRGRDGGERRE